MKRVTISTTMLLMWTAAYLLSSQPDSQIAVAQQPQPSANSRDQYSHRFPDANGDYVPSPDEYEGPLFRLSQDFPAQPQPWDAGLKKIMKMPYGPENDAWKKYLLTVRDYCFEGNIEVEFQGQDNPIRKWYHVPWQHWGENGREAIHGLTKEATAKPLQLAAQQTDSYQSYAVGVYNSVGAYTIGAVWKNEMQPDPTVAKFPPGTIVFKILFTQAPPTAVPYLQNPITWKAYAEQSDNDTKRSVQDVNLIQMDVMIRDDRTPTGWLFGNFCYNGALNNKNPWGNLVPVGLAWGDDPTVTNEPRKMNADGQPFPPQTTFNDQLKEVIINPSDELPPQHLGFGARLNGPLDYYNSSCMSCHSTAEYPALAQMNPQFSSATSNIKPGSKAWMRWFRNLPCGVPFTDGKAYSTDYSLQLAISLQNFYDWKSRTQKGYFNPAVVTAPGPRMKSSGRAPAVTTDAAEGSATLRNVIKIRRGPAND